MKFHKTFALLLTISLMLGCASAIAPYQAVSEAKQAISRAEVYLDDNASEADKKDYQLAIGLLQDGEKALAAGKYQIATVLINTGKQHAQAILKRRQQQRADNILFRY